MNRRSLLASLGASAGAAFAGCLGQPTIECQPQEGDVALAELTRSTEGPVEFRGSVVGFPDGGSVLLDDTTASVRVEAAEELAIQTDALAIGDCLSGEGVVLPDRSWEHGLAVVSVSELDAVGSSEREVSEYASPPAFDLSVTVESEDCEHDVTLAHDGGEEVPAGALVIRHRPLGTPSGGDEAPPGGDGVASEENEGEVGWDALADLDPDAAVEPDDALTLTLAGSHEGTVIWREEWGLQVADWLAEC